MLSDIERKTLRILDNYVRRSGPPILRNLEIKTGRNRAGVFAVLSELNKKGFIEWSPDTPDEMLLLRVDEDDAPAPKNPPSYNQRRWDYFMD